MIFIADDVVGRHASDIKGRPIGRVTAFYNYPTDLEAPWGVAAVTRGNVFKRSTHLVDLRDAQIDGEVLVVSYTDEKIDDAPHYRPLIGHTSAHYHAVEVLNHYRGPRRPA